MRKRSKIQTLVLTAGLLISAARGQQKYSAGSSFSSYKGLIMAGYQGWFNAPSDGSGMGWNHYARAGIFEPGNCKVDFWPDVSEYAKTYGTPFRKADGSTALVFSAYDIQTIFTHFRWMREYGVDGVFVQRSVTAIRDPKNLAHDDRVLGNALSASRYYHRAIAVMYDFSGVTEANGDWQLIINDWKRLVDSLKIAAGGTGQTYLYHRNRPLVALWGVGFVDRPNDLRSIERIMDFLRSDPVYGGCSVLLGVPAYWRDFGRDTKKDPYLHTLVRKADIIRPWFVGRFDGASYPQFKQRIREDLEWCRENKLDYAPVVFPGFSWHNMHPDSHTKVIGRDRGRFYWQQLTGAIARAMKLSISRCSMRWTRAPLSSRPTLIRRSA